MNKKAVGDLGTYGFAITIFLVISISIIWLITSIANDNKVTMSPNFNNISKVMYTDSQMYGSVKNMSLTLQPINDYNVTLNPLTWLNGAVQWVVNRYEDSMFSKAIKTVSIILKSVGAMGTFVLTAGNMFSLPSLIVDVIGFAIIIIFVIIAIYFYRGLMR
jgi:hypothetical protein